MGRTVNPSECELFLANTEAVDENGQIVGQGANDDQYACYRKIDYVIEGYIGLLVLNR